MSHVTHKCLRDQWWNIAGGSQGSRSSSSWQPLPDEAWESINQARRFVDFNSVTTITLLVLKLEFSRKTRSIQRLPMPWFIFAPPGPSATVILTMCYSDILVSSGIEIEQSVTFWCRGMMWNINMFCCCCFRRTWCQMEAFSALLAFCAGNSPVTGEFLVQRPVTPSFDVFFDLCLNKRLINTRGAVDLRRHGAH